MERINREQTHRNTVPVFVDHHNTQQDTQSEEEQAIQVMRDGVTYGDAEREQKNLSDRIERDSKDDVTEGPAVVKSSEYKNELQYGICGDAQDGPDEVNDEEGDRFRWGE
jgi:hypothetical protein